MVKVEHTQQQVQFIKDNYFNSIILKVYFSSSNKVLLLLLMYGEITIINHFIFLNVYHKPIYNYLCESDDDLNTEQILFIKIFFSMCTFLKAILFVGLPYVFLFIFYQKNQ